MATEPEWSRGPWAANLPTRSDGGLLVCHVLSADGGAVAQLASLEDRVTIANARLMAAAPDLYAALAEAIACLRTFAGGATELTIAKGSAALAKARFQPEGGE